MDIGNMQITIERDQHATYFTALIPRAAGVRTLLTLADLEKLARWLSNEATTWRKSIEPDYYAIFEIPRTATADEIKAAYRAMQKQFHTEGGSTGKSQAINAAYEVLSDPLKRKAFDESRLDDSQA